MPADTPLFFAVLDGPRPGEWPLFGTKFAKLISEARQKLKPPGVDADMLNTFDIYIEPVLKSPEELLKASHLDSLAGVIVDAVPKPGITNDLKERLKTFHQHVLKIKAAASRDSNPLYRRIGYEIWFITDGDPDELIAHVKQAYSSASMLKETTVNHYFLPSKDQFINHMAAYLANVYMKMYSGA